jgi:hypothetical protein
VFVDVVKPLLTAALCAMLCICAALLTTNSSTFEAPAEFLDQLNQDVADIDLI